MFRLVRAAVCGLLLVAPGHVSAATLTATFGSDVSFFGFEGATAGQTAFVIDFDDSLGSAVGVLEQAEFGSFAWVNNPFTTSTGQQFRTLLGVAPSIADLVLGFAFSPFSLQNVNWVFRQDPGTATGTAIAASAFTYSITRPTPPVDPVDPSVVPLPAAAWMLLAGMGGLAALRRRRG
jgi:hypothetical protein